jgi:hypothetical protein
MSKLKVEELRGEVMRLNASTLKVPRSPNQHRTEEEQKRADEIEEARSHPFKKYSLKGSSEHLEHIAVRQRPLLDGLCLAGQLTSWYAPPNAGKTLLALHLLVAAVEDCRINSEDVYYINVDDSTAGLAEKVAILEQRGVHVLGEGQRGFTASKLAPLIRDAIEQNKAHGLFLILDTLKKFVSLMDKKESSTFNALLRQFSAAGGTVLCLAHTNKRPGPNNELIYAGTSDVREDFDAAFIITPREEDSDEQRMVIEFKAIKGRGGSEDRVVFEYDRRPSSPYDERLASVVRLDPSGFAPLVTQAEGREQEVVAAIEARILQSPVQKMDLAKDVSAATGVGRHSVMKVINRYTGSDPTIHRWNFAVENRGAKVFRLIDRSDRSLPSSVCQDSSLPDWAAPATEPGSPGHQGPNAAGS